MDSTGREVEMYQMQIFAFRHHSIFDAALSEQERRIGRRGLLVKEEREETEEFTY